MNSTIAKKYRFLYYLIGVILLLFILQICSWNINDELLFPNIFSIIKRAFSLLGEGKTYLYIGNTLWQLIISLLFSFIIGISLGVLAAIYSRIDFILKPIMAFFRAVPVVVIVLVVMLTIGFDQAPIFACVLFIIPSIFQNTKEGVRSIDKTLLDVYKLETNFSIKGICKVHIPMVAAYIKAALIHSIGVGLKVLITTDYIAGVKNTIGSVMMSAPSTLDYEIIYAYTLILLIVIMIIELVAYFIEYLINHKKYNNNSKK